MQQKKKTAVANSCSILEEEAALCSLAGLAAINLQPLTVQELPTINLQLLQHTTTHAGIC
jgi:hypothetical protein